MEKEEGGLAFLKSMYYYWAANPYKLTFWVSDVSNEEALGW